MLAKLDLVLDVAGVGYIDGRESFLPYNVLTSLPFSMMGVRYFKLSQAIGPIGSWPNKVCSSLALSRVTGIFARGSMTERHLNAFFSGKKEIRRASDLAFLLKTTQAFEEPERRPRRLGIVASSLVMSHNSEYIKNMSELCLLLLSKGWEIVLIAHSWRDGTMRLRNNDLPALNAITESNVRLMRLRQVGLGLNASELKGEIGSCRVVLTSRFHGMVAALSTATPVLVAGWSHKYREVMAQFGLERFCLPHQKANAATLEKFIDELDSTAETISKKVSKRLPEVKADSLWQFDCVAKELRNSV